MGNLKEKIVLSLIEKHDNGYQEIVDLYMHSPEDHKVISTYAVSVGLDFPSYLKSKNYTSVITGHAMRTTPQLVADLNSTADKDGVVEATKKNKRTLDHFKDRCALRGVDYLQAFRSETNGSELFERGKLNIGVVNAKLKKYAFLPANSLKPIVEYGENGFNDDCSDYKFISRQAAKYGYSRMYHFLNKESAFRYISVKSFFTCADLNEFLAEEAKETGNLDHLRNTFALMKIGKFLRRHSKEFDPPLKNDESKGYRITDEYIRRYTPHKFTKWYIGSDDLHLINQGYEPMNWFETLPHLQCFLARNADENGCLDHLRGTETIKRIRDCLIAHQEELPPEIKYNPEEGSRIVDDYIKASIYHFSKYYIGGNYYDNLTPFIAEHLKTHGDLSNLTKLNKPLAAKLTVARVNYPGGSLDTRRELINELGFPDYTVDNPFYTGDRPPVKAKEANVPQLLKKSAQDGIVQVEKLPPSVLYLTDRESRKTDTSRKDYVEEVAHLEYPTGKPSHRRRVTMVVSNPNLLADIAKFKKEKKASEVTASTPAPTSTETQTPKQKPDELKKNK